jgi:gliding motility-associated-like protein
MIKFIRFSILPATVLMFLLLAADTLTAQTINDGCMRIRPYVRDSWVQEFEDPFQADEAAFYWFAADNADVDGQGWRNDYGFLYLTGSNYIGWRTIFEGGDDQAASHPLVNLFDQTYGTANTNVTVNTPRYIQIRGSYTGDDCGNASGCETCFADDDDYCYDDVLTTTFNYRFAPPNQNTTTSDVFTFNHGSAPPTIGGGSNYGARVAVEWSSPIPTGITASPSTSVCAGGSITLTATGGTVFGGSYTWETSTGTPVGSGATITVAPLSNTTYRVFCTNGGIKSLCYKDIDVFASSNPVANNTITPSNPVGPFCLTGDPGVVTGNTPSVALPTWSYQWETSTNGGASWTVNGPYSSAVLPYQFDPAATSQTLLVRRVILAGGCDNASNVLTYVIEQSIANNTISADQTLCGTSTPIGLTGTIPTGGNGGYAYQWQSATAFGGPYTNIGGANGQNYAPGALSATTYFRRVVTGGVCAASNSNVITITIQPVIAGNTISANQSFCGSGDPAQLIGTGTLTGGNGSYTYQWQESTDGGATWSAAASTSATFDPPLITQTTLYRRGVYSGTCFDNSAPVTITVYPVISNNAISADQSSCGPFTAATIIGTTPGGGTGSYTYQWEQNVNGGGWNFIGGAVSANYSPGVVSVTTQYRRTVNSLPCSDVSNVVTITVVPVIGNNVIDNYQRFCNSGDPAVINAAVLTGGNGTFNYQWESSPNNINWSTIAGANAATYDPPFTSATIYYHRLVTSGVCSSTSNTSTVLILALPQVTQVSHTDVLCNGGNTGTISVFGSATNGVAHFSVDGGTVYQNAGLFTGLTAGSYNIYVRDDSACVNSYAGNPEVVGEPAVLTHIATPQNASCDNVFDGSITVNAAGGVTPYSYSLNGGPSQSNNIFNGLSDGSYTVLVTDDNGCFSSSNVIVDTAYAVYASLVSQTAVSCYGGVDGTVTVQLTGGLPPYSYSINGVQFVSSPTFTGLSSGTYVVTLRDSKGCTDFVNVTITQPNQLQAQIDSVINIGCNGASTGAIYISVTGGNQPYNFLWSNGATSEDITGLVAGTYNVAITDAKGCTASVGATISQPLPLFLNIASFHNLSCYNDSTGSIDVTANGGVPPYSFTWSNGATTEDIFGLLPNTYSVTVTDANGCQQNISQLITQPTQLATTISSTQVLCAGAASGSVDLDVTGGTAPYNYVWSNGATSQDLSGVSGGLYTVIIYDANGCSITNSTTVTEPAPITISLVKTDVLCNGDSTGAIDITVNGGTPVITYVWSNAATSEDLTGIPSGNYSVIITDGNSCTASASATIAQPSALVLNATTVNVGCSGGANGSVDITVQGGVFPYTYAWSNNATTEDINGLSGGTYTVSITDANGCSLTASFTITEPTPIVSNIVGTNVTCFGASNGATDLTVSGGTAPYSFLWNTFQTIEDLSGISGGTYYVIITDANGCTKHDSVVITEAPALVLSVSVTNVLCNGAATGAVDLTVSGGAPAYTYAWSNSAITEDISGVVAGNYIVTVTDAATCSASASATIAQPTALVLNSSVQNVGCAGGNDGAIDITVQGGTFPYTFSWSNNSTNEDINNVGGGNYDVTITDANGCTLSASFTITEPNAIVSSITGTDVSCNGVHDGAADLTVSGGSAPYTFLWSTFQGTEDISGLNGGLYYVIITDANGCEHKDSVFIAEPASLVLTTAVTNISCFNANDGVIDLTVAGGTPGYTYAWSNNATTEDLNNLPGGLYVVTVTDTHGCTATASATIVNPSAIFANFINKNPLCYGDTSGRIDLIASGGTPPYTYLWSNNATTEDLLNVPAGTYIVTITDSRNCAHIDSATITEPGQIYTSGVVKNVSCAGLADGFVDITAYAGTLPYSYTWSTQQSTEDIFSLPGGDYYVTVTDANGCLAVSIYTVKEPLPLGISIVKTDVLCNGSATGTLAAIPTGGTHPYYYLWNNFETDSAIVGVEAGRYVIQLTDSNGCFIYDSVNVLEPAKIAVTGVVTDAVCYGSATGNVNITVSGGVTPYSFAWSNTAITEDLSGVVAGSYTVTVTDANLCSLTATFKVEQGIQIIPALASLDPICHGGNTGSITAITSGGVQPYSYLWSNNKTTVAVGNLVAGTYTLTVTDALSCTATATATITDPAAIVVTATANGAKCFNTASGNVSTIVTGGFAPYTYLLNGVGQATDTFNNLFPGDYILIVTDVNGCQGSANFSVSSPSEIGVDLITTQQVILTGMQTQLVATATSVSPIVNYYWSPSIDSEYHSIFDYSNCGDSLNCSNPFATPHSTTTFTVVVMNSDSCYASDTVTVQVLNQPSAFLPTAFTPNNDGLNDRFEFDILGATNINVAIFDRWGQRIYYNANQANGINNQNGWDGTLNGKPAPFDTYVYQLKVTYYDSVTKDFSGTVTLMK